MVFFPALISYLFLLKCSDTHFGKDKIPEAVYFLKVSNEDTLGIIESFPK